MKLLTKSLEKRFAEIGSQEQIADPVVVAKHFLPGHSATWYSTEYDPIQETFFGFVSGLGHDEWGYYSLYELATVRAPLPVERDLHCGEMCISQHYPQMADNIKRRQEMIDIEIQREQERADDLQR